MALPLLEKLGVAAPALEARLREDIEKRPRVTGAAGQHYLGTELRTVLDGAEKQMKALKDEFVSGEHYLLALTESDAPGRPAARRIPA